MYLYFKIITMQKIFLSISIALFFLTSCNMHEEIDLSKEGNGHYQISVDMSQALEMMKSMGGSGKIPDSVANKKADTTLSLNYMIDSSGGEFTAAEKAYFYNGHMNVKVDMQENKMDIILKFPVKNAMDLKNFFTVYDKVDSLNKIKKKEKEAAEAGNNNEMPNAMDPSKGMMDASSLPVKRSPYIITDTSIERMVQTSAEMMGDMGEQAQGAEMFMGQMTIMTTIKLPRPVKRLEGKNVKLSDDKRSIFFSATMAEMKENPEVGGFKVVF